MEIYHTRNYFYKGEDKLVRLIRKNKSNVPISKINIIIYLYIDNFIHAMFSSSKKESYSKITKSENDLTFRITRELSKRFKCDNMRIEILTKYPKGFIKIDEVSLGEVLDSKTIEE